MPERMSNSASLSGGATLFFATLTRTRLPIASTPSFSVSIRRMSRRTEELNFSARPPGVVSGLPNMTPIFSRSWFVNRQIVSVRLRVPASFRSAWDISRAWRPTCESPISPSISAFGVSAATESIATTSSAPERMSSSVISSACSPVSGCETSSSSTLTPIRFAYPGSIACSASMKAQMPPRRRASGTARVRAVEEGPAPPPPLRLRDHVVDERRLARRFRAEDLDDAAARQAADAECEVERERPRRDRADRDGGGIIHLHDGALAELPLDLSERDVQSLLAIHLVNLLGQTIRRLHTAPPRTAAPKGRRRHRTD